MEVRAFRQEDIDAVVALWVACGLTRSWNDPQADIDRKLADSPELLLVGFVDRRLVASVMAGYDGHRGWMNYLAVAPHARGHGYGRAIVEAAEARLVALGCAKINLQVRDDNAAAQRFYEAIGYTRDPVISYGKRLIDD